MLKLKQNEKSVNSSVLKIKYDYHIISSPFISIKKK